MVEENRIQVRRRVELTIEVEVVDRGKQLSANVLREIELALRAGCEYAPQLMRMGPVQAARFHTPIPVWESVVEDPDAHDIREEDLAELARLRAEYE